MTQSANLALNVEPHVHVAALAEPDLTIPELQARHEYIMRSRGEEWHIVASTRTKARDLFRAILRTGREGRRQ